MKKVLLVSSVLVATLLTACGSIGSISGASAMGDEQPGDGAKRINKGRNSAGAVMTRAEREQHRMQRDDESEEEDLAQKKSDRRFRSTAQTAGMIGGVLSIFRH